MANNLTTVRGTPAYTAAKFSNGLSGGVIGATGTWDNTTMTVEAWVKITSTSGIYVALSWGNSAYIGINAGKLIVNSTSQIAYTIGDGSWHHVAFTRNAQTWRVWVDGQGPTAIGYYGPTTALRLGGLLDIPDYDWPAGAMVDEVRISNVVRYTEAFTPPAAPFTVDANTVDLYHLESDGTSDTATPPDTTAPTAGTLGAVMGSTTADLTVSGAADETALHATPYAYSSNNGGTWTAYQAGATYQFTGLTPETSYTFQHKVRDAAENETLGTAVTDTTDATPTDTTPPTAGTLASSSITDTSFTLTVTGATDETALDAAPYAFSTDGGSTYTAWQASNVYTATGLDAETAYTCVHKVRDAAGNVSTGTAITVTTSAVVPGSPTDPNILYSPGNWNVTETAAITVNAGAYMRFSVAATSITLNFDTTNNAAPLPRIKYRIDDAGWVKQAVASSVVLTIPTSTTWGVHVVEVVVAYVDEGQQRWTPALVSHVTFTGMTLSAGGTTRPMQPKPISGIIYGDSITEGVRDLKINDLGDGDDATVNWPYLLGEFAGAEVGAIGFGAQGWNKAGSGGVPGLFTSYASIYSGVARSFAGLDFIVINHGTNNPNATAGEIASFLTTLLAACDTSTRILVMRPLSGSNQTLVHDAVTAAASPRISYVDTTGWWNSADSSDGTHPYGYASFESLAPRLASAVRDAISEGGAIIVGGGTFGIIP